MTIESNPKESDPLIVKTKKSYDDYHACKIICIANWGYILGLLLIVLMICLGIYMIMSSKDQISVKCDDTCRGLIRRIVYDNSTNIYELYFNVYCQQDDGRSVLITVSNSTDYHVDQSYTLYQECKYYKQGQYNLYSLSQTYREELAHSNIRHWGELFTIFGSFGLILYILAVGTMLIDCNNELIKSMNESTNTSTSICTVIYNLPYIIFLSYYYPNRIIVDEDDANV